MKKLIELGKGQASLMYRILSEEFEYDKRKIKKFNMIKEKNENDIEHYWLAVDGKLDTIVYGNLMYRLGKEIMIEQYNESK